MEKQREMNEAAVPASVLAAASDNVAELISIVDAGGKLLYANQSYRGKLGETYSAFGCDAIGAFHPEDAVTVRKVLLTPPTEWGSPLPHLRYTLPDETIIPVEIRMIPIPSDGGASGAVIVARDLTESLQKEYEARLLAHAISVTKDCYCLTDIKQAIIYVNPTLLEMLRYPEAEVLGKLISSFYSDRNHISIREVLISLSADAIWEGEVLLRRGDGTDVPIHLWRSAVKNDDHTIMALAYVMRDLSSSKRAEQAQDAVFRIGEAADRSEGLDQLYSSVHQIISTVMHARNFYISLYDERDDIVSFPYFVDEVDVSAAPQKAGRGLTEYVLRTGKSLLCTTEVQKDLQRRSEADLVGAPSPIWLGVPLILEGKPIGVMVVQHYSDPNAYGEREKQILEFVSSQVARAIERKRTEQALKAGKERYQRFVEQSSEGIWRLELDEPVQTALPVDEQIELFYKCGYLAECNNVMAAMYGFSSASELIGARLEQFLVKSESRNTEFLRAFIQSGYRLAEAESHEVDRHGNTKYFLNNFVGTIENGLLIESWGTQRDITERKKAEEALLANERRFRALIENSSDGIAMLSKDGSFIFLSPSTERILGYSSRELLGKNPLSFVHNDDRVRAHESLQQLPSNSRGMNLRDTFRVRHKDSTWRWLEIIGSNLVDDPNVQAIVTNFRDITERMNAEQLLRDSEEKFRSLFQESQDGVFLSTPEGKVIDVNPAGVKLFGYLSPEELLSVDIVRDLYANPSDRVKFKDLLERQGTVKDFELEIKRKDGERRHVLESASVVRNLAGSITAYRVFVRDITERKRLEGQLRQAQKMEGIGTLAGGIAHDFNNLLGIILGYTQLLEMGNTTPDRFAKSIDTIKKAVERGAGLVRQLLTFARKADPSFHPIEVNETVREMSKVLKETFPKSIAIENVLRESIPRITADTTQLHQALLNLCVNSRDSMIERKDGRPTGGTLRLMTGSVNGSEIQKKFPEALSDQFVVVSVQDTGEGMDEATKSHIFEPFFTTKELGKGTGLGLAVVYGVINSHHGFIDVESTKGVGTTFHLYFPVSDDLVVEIPEAPERNDRNTRGHETILIVEDEEMLRNLVKDLLESSGYHVFAAADGMEGYEIFKAHSDRVALVLSDMGLPRLGGWEMFQKMRELKPNVQAILASGYFDPNLKLDMLKAGARDFIQKPYVSDEILKRIREILDESLP